MSVRQNSVIIAGGNQIDNVPTSGSSNPVSSGGVYNILSGWTFPDLTTGVTVSTSGFTSTKKQWFCIRAGATNNYFNVLVNGVIVSTRYSTANTNTTNWYPLDVGDVVTFAGTSSYFDCAIYDMKGL